MKRLLSLAVIMLITVLAGGVELTSAAEPLSFQMPENKAVIVPGVIATPSKLGSKYYLVAKGGTPPYTLTAAGDAVSVGLRRSKTDTFDITPLRAGVATLTLRDSTGATTTAQFVVSAQTALSASISRRNLVVGETDVLQVSGGTLPYSAKASNDNVSLSPSNSTSWIVKAVKSGDFSITVSDKNQNTVGNAGVVLAPLTGSLTPTPSGRLTLQIGSEVNLAVSGGIKPYNAKVNNASVSLTKTGDNTWRVKAASPGEFVITVEDASQRGLSYNCSGTVPQLTEVMMKLSANTIHVSDSALNPREALLSISGGLPPYTVSQTPDRRLTITKISESSYKITGGHPGGAVHTLSVKDSAGKTTSSQISITRPLVVKCPTREVVIPENSPGRIVTAAPIYIDIMNGSGPLKAQNLNPELVDLSPVASGTRPTYERPQERAGSASLKGKAPGTAKIKVSDDNTSIECAVKVVRFTPPGR